MKTVFSQLTPLAKRCPSCSTSNPDNEDYCRSCGNALSPGGDPWPRR